MKYESLVFIWSESRVGQCLKEKNTDWRRNNLQINKHIDILYLKAISWLSSIQSLFCEREQSIIFSLQ